LIYLFEKVKFEKIWNKLDDYLGKTKRASEKANKSNMEIKKMGVLFESILTFITWVVGVRPDSKNG
jgi:hypothetical protein